MRVRKEFDYCKSIYEDCYYFIHCRIVVRGSNFMIECHGMDDKEYPEHNRFLELRNIYYNSYNGIKLEISFNFLPMCFPIFFIWSCEQK